MTVDHHRIFDSFTKYDTPDPVGVKLPEIAVEPNAGPIGVNGAIQSRNKDGAARINGSRRSRQGKGRRARNLIKRLCI